MFFTGRANAGIFTCTDAMCVRDGKWVEVAGLVLVRQRKGSVKGVMLVTLEGESGSANVVVWPSMFEKQRRVLLGSTMKVAGQHRLRGNGFRSPHGEATKRVNGAPLHLRGVIRKPLKSHPRSVGSAKYTLMARHGLAPLVNCHHFLRIVPHLRFIQAILITA